MACILFIHLFYIYYYYYFVAFPAFIYPHLEKSMTSLAHITRNALITKLHLSWQSGGARFITNTTILLFYVKSIKLRSNGTLVGCQASSFVLLQPPWHRSNSIKPFHQIQCEHSFKYTITHRSIRLHTKPMCVYEFSFGLWLHLSPVWNLIALSFQTHIRDQRG